MAEETISAAIPGHEYSGVLEVMAGKEGEAANFQLGGEGWNVISLDVDGARTVSPDSPLRIPFRAIPTNASQRLRFSMTYDGRPVTRSFLLDAESLVGRDVPRRAEQLANRLPEPGIAGQQPRSKPEDLEGPVAGSPAGCNGFDIRFLGRIAFQRPATAGDINDFPSGNTMIVGADNLLVEIYDEDDDPIFGDELMWSGFTDENGYFDVTVCWDDCDFFGCDDPDIYIYFETDNDVVVVQDDSVLEVDYTWSTEDTPDEINDFMGPLVNFGTIGPFDPADDPALHIHNSITRAHRFILERDGTDVEQVDVIWPDDDGGAFYNNVFDEIHIPTNREWNEGTQTHEYGHHFLENYSDSNIPSYCNGFCDVPSCGHCAWCQENQEDAWAEGWPNWLADVVTRSYATDYEDSQGNPYQPILPRDQEMNSVPCGADGLVHPPAITEGFVGALLRDIEDVMEDAEDPDGDGTANGDGNPDVEPACARDALSLGVEEIFFVVRENGPETVFEFIDGFRFWFPEHGTALWKTANSIGGATFTWPDTAPPGAVTTVTSPTHPTGAGGPSPIITVNWTEAPDEASGADVYAVAWYSDPTGQPFFQEQINRPIPGTEQFQVQSPALGLGEWWLGIRAQDCIGQWSAQLAFFGPFEINECNGNGIIDICETDCNAIATCGSNGKACQDNTNCPPGDSCDAVFCNVSNCGSEPDCQPNGSPDTCDLADGTSKDCNVNRSPDECEAVNFVEWQCCIDGDWYDYIQDVGPAHWPGPDFPGPLDHVCIDLPSDGVPPVITHSGGYTDIASIGCYPWFSLEGGTLAPDETSGFYDYLVLLGGFLSGTADYELWGETYWNFGGMGGSGTTQAHGPIHFINDEFGNGLQMLRDDRHVEASSTYWSGGLISMFGNAVFDNVGSFVVAVPASTDQVDSKLYWSGGNPRFINHPGATLVKQPVTGETHITVGFQNDGLVDVQGGTLVVNDVNYSGAVDTGNYVGAVGAEIAFQGGVREFSDASSISGESIRFGSGGTFDIGGSFDVSATTRIGSAAVDFLPGCNLVNVGGLLEITRPNPSLVGVVGFATGIPVTLADVMLGGTLTGIDDVNVMGTLTWAGGTMTVPAGHPISDPVTTHVSGLLHLSDGLMTISGARHLNNTGSARWTGGEIRMSDTARINNTSVFDIEVMDSSITWNGGSPTWDNQITGSLVKRAGSGQTNINVALNNDGMIEIEDGTLRLGNGSTISGLVSGSPGSTIAFGSGNHDLAGTSNVTVDNVIVDGVGTANFGGTFDVTSTTEVASATAKFLPGMNLISHGNLLALTRPNPSFISTVDFSTGGTVSLQNVALNGNLTGTDMLDITGGLNWTGGTMTVPPGHPSDSPVDTTVNGVSILDGGPKSVSGARRLITNDHTRWTSGALELSGSAEIRNNGQLDVEFSGAVINWNGGNPTFSNPPTAQLKKFPGTHETRCDVFMNNKGIVDIADGSLALYGGSMSTGQFTGATGSALVFGFGDHQLTATSIIDVDGVFCDDNGVVSIAGTYDVDAITQVSFGTLSFEPGTNLVNIGNELRIEQTNPAAPSRVELRHGTSLAVSYLDVSGASVGQAAVLEANQNLIVTDQIRWNGGRMSGSGVTMSLTDLQLQGDTGVVLTQGRSLVSAGTAQWTGIGNITLGDGAALNNLGMFNVETDADIRREPLGDPQVSNLGLFAKRSGSGITEIDPPFANAAMVEVNSGILQFNDEYTQSEGSTRLSGGDITALTGLEISGGVLEGSGTVTGSVTIGSEASPGLSIGSLTISENYAQTDAGVLTIELGGSGNCEQFDQLIIGGDAALGGTLRVVLAGDCMPVAGQVFPIVNYDELASEFGALEGPCGVETTGFKLVYGSSQLLLVANADSATGDLNYDGRIDLADVALFQQCFSEPGDSISTCCAAVDFDDNDAVMLNDYLTFQSLLTGP
ncbi:MAG: hypothetical protein ACYTHJ_16450 [Planctomycetota bacterium]